MKIIELVEARDPLEEGPILNKLGTMAGNAVGTVAKGVGAVAGGVAGAWDAAKKGFKAIIPFTDRNNRMTTSTTFCCSLAG